MASSTRQPNIKGPFASKFAPTRTRRRDALAFRGIAMFRVVQSPMSASQDVILREPERGERPQNVILSRAATKGSLSIHGFYCLGARAILSLAPLAQDDAHASLAQDDAHASVAPLAQDDKQRGLIPVGASGMLSRRHSRIVPMRSLLTLLVMAASSATQAQTAIPPAAHSPIVIPRS